MHGTVVGVLRGGPSHAHESSLKSGHAILSHLPSERFIAHDVYIDQQGIWHDRGLPTIPGRVLPTIDVAIIALHGGYGQSGEVQKVLEQFGVPYTGADSFHSFHASHKVLAKEQAVRAGIRTPRYHFADRSDSAERLAREAVRSFLQPVVVKPVGVGSSASVSFVSGYKPVHDAISSLFAEGARGVLVEEHIQGREVSIGIVEGLRGEELYALPPMEVTPSEDRPQISLARLSHPLIDELTAHTRTMHRALGQKHYSCSDFIVSDKGIYFIKTNPAAAVGMTGESRMSASLAAVGVQFKDFLEHTIDRALAK